MTSKVSFAEAYPFEQPKHDQFALINGEAFQTVEFCRQGHGVLATGSNASPVQLRRKFGERRKPLMVEAVTIRDHVIVYSAHFARYGSIPATLTAYPGAVTQAHVTWLDDNDLELMHQSEALGINYDYVLAGDLQVFDRHGRVLAIDGFYASKRGLLKLQDQPIRLAATISTNANWPALTQRALLKAAANRLMPEMAYSDFMSLIIADLDFRQSCSRQMGQWGQSLSKG